MISIFLSSTFRDMQKERDLIHRYVLPRVQVYAGKYHELVNIVDLHWGIDTGQMNQQTAMDKVLLTCKSMIQECRPCFVGGCIRNGSQRGISKIFHLPAKPQQSRLPKCHRI